MKTDNMEHIRNATPEEPMEKQNMNICLVPYNNRVYLKDSNGNLVMNRNGYKSKEAAGAARWYYLNARTAMQRIYKHKAEINNKHLWSL